jgi:Glycosyl transferases group 1/Methyltransferase domain
MMMIVERKPAERLEGRIASVGACERASDHCSTLFVTDGNFLGDSVEANAHRAMLGALAGHGSRCEVVCRFLVPDEEAAEPGPWLAERQWSLDATAGPGEAPPELFPEGQGGAVLYVTTHGVPVTLFQGSSTKPHDPDADERGRFLRLVGAALDGRRPDVVVVSSGPCLADVLAAARARDIATVALQADCTPRDPAPFREADVVLVPTRFAAEYLREALGLPCAHLPPFVGGEQIPAEPTGPGAVVFDGSAPGRGLAVFVQVAAELLRRRPEIPILIVGGTGTVSLPGGGTARCVPAREWAQAWASARVLLAPVLSWEYTPLSALSAVRHGLPVIASDRGALPELLEGAALLLPVPGGVTAAVPAALGSADLSLWAETVLRLYEDHSFAASQRSRALIGGQRWAPERLVAEYARFFAAVAARRRRSRQSSNERAAPGNGSNKALRRFAEAHAWPKERPEDAAPGQEQGWLGAGTEVMLSRALSPATHLVVELGAWLGLSTRFIANHAPNAVVISVDHWKGSPEHVDDPRYKRLLPQLYETFLARCWDYRDRIVPLRMSSLDGLRKVAECGLQPDVVYIDAEHSFVAVSAELALARRLFPLAALTGDDYDWAGVREAVHAFARQQGMVVDRVGWRGWRLLENWQAGDAGHPPPGRTQAVVMVPHMNGIEWECDQALQRLEQAGVRVVRRPGCSAIDVARNEMLSDALHDGAEAMMFIDSDIGFDPADALRLLARPEPVVCGVYAKKGRRELASEFAGGVKEVLFGPDAAGPYPLRYAATGFLRVRAGVLRRMIADLRLPLCNTHWGRGVWPFFMPLMVPHGPDKLHYLGEDWAFSHRLGQVGVTPLADTSVRLWHWGRYGYGWEDAGGDVPRYRSYSYHFTAR